MHTEKEGRKERRRRRRAMASRLTVSTSAEKAEVARETETVFHHRG